MIAITGANGYVGGLLVEAFTRRGVPVRRLVRTPDDRRGDARFVLGEDVAPGTLAGVDALIHAAYDFRPPREDELRRRNVDGTRKLFDAARRAGVARVLFVSSIASYGGSHSAYGRAKWTIEQETAAAGWTSIRPGMVYGPDSGGLFAALDRVVRVAPVLPDFGKRTRLFVVHSGDLVRIIEAWWDLPAGPQPPLLRAAHPQLFSMRGVLEVIARAAGKRPAFLPAPPGLVLAALRASEAVGVVLPFRSDSLVSMLHGNPDPQLASDVLGVPMRALTPETLRGTA